MLIGMKKYSTKSITIESKIKMNEMRYSVLYIEDNPANLRLVEQILSMREDINFSSAHEPFLGLELAFAHQPDLILLDINLPGMSGFEVLKKIHQHKDPEMKNTTIIAVSANAMQSDIDKGFEAGFDEYVTKPISVKALLETIEKFLPVK